VVDLSSTAAEMAAGFSEMNSNNKKKDAFFDMKAKEFDMKAKVFDMFMSLGKKDVAEKVANTLLEYCINSSTPGEVVQQEEENEEEVAEEEEEEDTGSPDLGWAHNEEEDQQEEHDKNGDTGDTESVGSETVLNEPPPRQASFLSSGFGTQTLMETQSRFTDNRMPPEGCTLNGAELEAEWCRTRG
jgi:hypothetical protein